MGGNSLNGVRRIHARKDVRVRTVSDAKYIAVPVVAIPIASTENERSHDRMFECYMFGCSGSATNTQPPVHVQKEKKHTYGVTQNNVQIQYNPTIHIPNVGVSRESSRVGATASPLSITASARRSAS